MKEKESGHDCCHQEEQEDEHGESGRGVKEYLLIGAIGLILVLSVVQAFQISSVKAELTGNAVAASSGGAEASAGAIDTTGWTENEIMNYEMHGTIPARAKGSSSSSSSSASAGMVGGC